MSNFQAPPTYAELLLVDPKTKRTTFNPIWLNWFISLTQNIGATGPVNSVTASAPLASSGGANPNITISAIPNTSLDTMPAHTFKANNTGGVATPVNITVAQAQTELAVPPQTIAAWTPTDNSGAALAFTGVSANYTQLGNMVFAYFVLTYPVTASGANASIAGLPVTVANANYAQVPSIVAVTAGLTVVLVPIKNTTTAAFDVATSLAAVTNLQLSGSVVKCLLAYPAT